ncbi:MAG: 50S ribosomal protein L25 [Deltaproteobacteria bacterium]|nr:50S ribosomal protein L25 [Deltaproteobacteria bacterium]
MDYPVVRAKDRPFKGKGFARKVRQLGYLPAVIYGQGTAARPLVVDPKTIVGVLTGPRAINTVVRLEIEKKDGKDECLAIVREYQIHPVKRALEHCDFQIVDESTEMTIKVPIRTTGRSEGEKVGAVLNIALREVSVRCKAPDVPEAIVVDVTPLQLNQAMLLSDLPYPAGTRPVFVKDRAAITVRMPKAEKVEEAAAAEGEAAPAEGEAPAAEGAAPAAGAEKKAEAPAGKGK